MSYALRTEQRKARKPHSCWFCREPILAGENYEYRSGFEDGTPWEMRCHPECVEATKDWESEDYECLGQGRIKRGLDEPR